MFDGYTIERLLGTGGMGEVYLAQHPRLPRREALKILPTSVSADPQYRRRFEREADIAASLWHSHIVEVHDRGEYDGQLWIAMAFVDGTDAAQLVRQRYPYGMPPEDVFEIVSAIADALDYAHERNLLHRDVKPANILITDPHSGERRILLADFGIARDSDNIDGLTATNVTVGSVAYAAPEQLTGQALDGRADQYALACTAFHLLTGKPPFEHSNPAVVIGNHLSSSPPHLGSLRARLGPLDSVLAKAMAKDPADRFPTCREFASAFGDRVHEMTRSSDPTQLATRIPGSADRDLAPANRPAWGSTNRRIAFVGGGVAVLLAIGVVAFIGTRLAQPNPAPTASVPLPSASLPGLTSVEPPQTVTVAEPPSTVTQTARPSTTAAQPLPAAGQGRRPGDLGLPQPMSDPVCNGQGIVILGSVTTPGLYAAGVQRLLDANPGSFYLRTDQTCPSLRAETGGGNAIYAVFVPGGTTQSQVCAAVHRAGGDAYGKWLDFTTDPKYIIPC